MTPQPLVDRALGEGDVEAVDEFIARVLRRAHQDAEARDEPGDARAILEVAARFADELTAGDPAFDRVGFVQAATASPA
jgi:hypothetical protein